MFQQFIDRLFKDGELAAAPELLFERQCLMLNRPGGAAGGPLLPDLVQDDAQVPILQAVAEEQHVAGLEWLGDDS